MARLIAATATTSGESNSPGDNPAGTAGQIFTDGTNTGFEQGRVQSHVVLQDSMKSALPQYTPLPYLRI